MEEAKTVDGCTYTAKPDLGFLSPEAERLAWKYGVYPYSRERSGCCSLVLFIFVIAFAATCAALLVPSEATSNDPSPPQTTSTTAGYVKAVNNPPSASTVGIASWYDYDLKGYPDYSKSNLTAASRDFPRGTRLKVCRIGSNACVVVRVNDYGPEHCADNPVACPERDIDLSSAAFKKLAPLKHGLLKVIISKQ